MARGLVVGWSASVERRLGRLYECREFEARPDAVEAVHELRVASRRLRALAEAVEPVLPGRGPRRVEQRLARLTRAVATLREWDVLALDVDVQRAVRPASEQPGILELSQHIAARRARERNRARERLTEIDLERIALGFRELRAGLVLALQARGARTVIGKLLAEPLRRARHAWPAADAIDDERVHTFRVCIKRLRYALEIAEVSARGLAALRRDLEHLQELLGRHHDRVVLHELVVKRRDKLYRDVAMRLALDAWQRAIGAERDEALERARAAWNEIGAAALESRVAQALAGDAQRRAGGSAEQSPVPGPEAIGPCAVPGADEM